MSLGWQCESAILPSKAKPIKVDSTSILGLKALVYDQEQKRTNNGASKGYHSGVHKAKPSKDKYLEKSAETTTRKASDVKFDPDNKEAKVLQSLTAKANLYEAIMKGNISGASSLVQFENKSDSVAKPAANVSQPHPVTAVEEFDEYGRVKPQYHWSTGEQNPTELYISEKLMERNFQRTMENSIQAQLASASSATVSSSSGPVSHAARVKTQWEKTLNNSARGFLDEIHRDTETERRQGSGESGGSVAAIGGGSESTAASKKRTMREERLEMLRQKQQKVNGSQSVPSV